jgi:hypothetical protein
MARTWLRLTLLSAVAVAGFAQGAAAQKIPASKVEEFSKSGTCVEAQLERIEGVNRVANGIGYTFVLKGGARLTINSATAADNVDEPLRVFDEVTVYGSDPDTKKLLVSARDHKLCGWAAPDALLLDARGRVDRDGPQPLLVKDTQFGKTDPGNSLNLKIVLHNFRVEGKEGTPVFEAPGGSKLPGSQNLFHIYEVFRVVAAVDPETKANARYYLAGWTPEGGGTAGHKKFIGWVREKDFYAWSSRMTVIWAEGPGQPRGYLNPERLQTADKAVFEGPAGFNESTRAKIDRRFPVLEQFPSEASVRAGLRKPVGEVDVGSKVQWYHVAVPGEACEDLGSGQKGKCMSSAASDEQVAQFYRGVKTLANADIMFVIDNTLSMTPYLKDVRDAVGEFVRKHGTAGARNEGAVRVGAAVYGDYRGPTAQLDKVQFNVVVPLGNPDTGSFGRLLGAETFSDEQRDKLEAPFAALINAAKQRSWSEAAAYRYIVHIADHGNREMGGKSPEGTSNLTEQVSISDVVAALKDSRVNYVPIAVRGDSNTSNPHAEAARKAFLRQAREIQQLAPDNAKELQLTYDENSPGLIEKGQKDRILAAMEYALELSTDALQQVDQMISCKTTPGDPRCKTRPSSTSGPGDSSGRINARVMKEQGLTTEAANVLTHKQTISAYYFPPNGADGKPTFTFWVALDTQTIVSLHDVAQIVCRTIDQRGAFKQLKRELLQSLESKTGESFASPAEGIQKGLFVPASHLSKWLSRDWGEIERSLDEARPDELETIKKEFCKKKTQLQLVIEGSRADDRDFVWNPKDRGWDVPVAKKRAFGWNFVQGDELPFYFIPVDYLP